MGIKDLLINLLLDGLRVRTEALKSLVDEADLDRDGYVSMRELYDAYRKWRHD